MTTHQYPKRLIEVDLPIARISAHARREKSIRQGHISTLHIWWARRPLAACRAVICASLWPDPADERCPPAFREAAVDQIKLFAARVYPKKITSESRELQQHGSPESMARCEAIAAGTLTLDAMESVDLPVLRMCLLDFIADFANWQNSKLPAYLEISRELTQAAHEALGGVQGTRPLVIDPFSGGGSIPLEALRVGADAFASDLNPVVVLLNKVILEYIPKYGKKLVNDVGTWGDWVEEKVERELSEFYPKDPDGAMPIAYLWARTIDCEGPHCGAEVPILRSLWLAKKGRSRSALRIVRDVQQKRVEFEIVENVDAKVVEKGTVARGSVTCPLCGFTTPADNVRAQFQSRCGGANDARLLCVVTVKAGKSGRFFRLPSAQDQVCCESATKTLAQLVDQHGESLLPDEVLPYLRSIFNIHLLGVNRWKHLFSNRQLLALITFVKVIQEASDKLTKDCEDDDLRKAIVSCLALTLSKLADLANSLCAWEPNVITVQHLFGRQAMGIIWDFAEGNPIGQSRGSWHVYASNTYKILSAYVDCWRPGTVAQASATEHPLPNDAVDLFATDPPYYDAVPYADLSDFFYVWLKRIVGKDFSDWFSSDLTPKKQEIVQLAERNKSYAYKTKENYERLMTDAMAEGRRVLSPDGLGMVVFAHKTTVGWETQLQSLITAGWVITASWPIDTELATRLRGMNSAVLGSSVHLICRPRENADGSLREDVGEWRDVLAELPNRIHEWMPRLAAEGIVGADAIFACLGPALEIFSRYSRVEKASGEVVPLRDYLEQVWAAVSTEALSMIFKDADAAGLEPDARLTAMWLWTLGTSASELNGSSSEDKVTASKGYVLEFDAARKIAQGLGIHLEQSESIVEVKGDKARLLPASERTRDLFGQDESRAAGARGRKKKKEKQRSLFEELDELDGEAETAAGELKPQAGETVLDRVHQSMILFASGRGEALRRFLVEDGAGTDARFWKLAQSLSALYLKDTDEKRWVDGVLARKKGLGL